MRHNDKLEQWDRENFFHPSTHLAEFARGNVPQRVITGGSGCHIEDRDGNRMLDAFAGLYCVNVGYGRESIAQAVHDQLMKMCYFAQAAGSIPGSLFAEKLIEKMPGLSRLYYCNSGSEANEKAFKMVRQISHKRYGGKKYKVYVKNPQGNVVKVNFGHGGSSAKGKTMSIKKSNPERRKSFRARHNCDNPGPRHKARYWSCRAW